MNKTENQLLNEHIVTFTYCENPYKKCGLGIWVNLNERFGSFSECLRTRSFIQWRGSLTSEDSS